MAKITAIGLGGRKQSCYGEESWEPEGQSPETSNALQLFLLSVFDLFGFTWGSYRTKIALYGGVHCPVSGLERKPPELFCQGWILMSGILFYSHLNCCSPDS